MQQAFHRWGLPRRIKIDNGYPFKVIGTRDFPSALILWWIGLGIDVTLNHPGCPQENGTVEGLQGISYRWVNPAKYSSASDLQEAMNEISRRQRETYRIRALGDKTRKQLYPKLESNPNTYQQDHFNVDLVKKYLAQYVFIRRISTNAIVNFACQDINVKYKHRNQNCTVTFSPDENHWIVKTMDGTIVKKSVVPEITADKILSLSLFSKNS